MNLHEIEINSFLKSVNEHSGNKLKNLEDLTRLFEIANNNNLTTVLEKIIFSAKAFNGLMRIIKNIDNKFDDAYFEKLKLEIKHHTEVVMNGLKEISEKGGSFIAEIFAEKYLTLSTECMQNLSILCSDLEYVKLYLNDNKSN